jgi:putative thiamine transport system permease protein
VATILKFGALEGIRRLGTRWISPTSWRNDILPRFAAAAALGISAGAVFASLLSMVLWSFARSWRFPDALPSGLTLANWTRNFSTFQSPLLNTITLGASAVVIALLLAVGVLEHEARSGQRTFVSAAGVLYLPLVVPQIAFFLARRFCCAGSTGWTVDRVDLDASRLCLPYVFLSLSDTYRAWDEVTIILLCVWGNAGPECFVKVPMLLRPIMTAGAVGFAVSVGLYLPTLC